MRAEDLLPDPQTHIQRDGIAIRKGTVGAFLANAKIWTDPETPSAARQAAQRDIQEALPALRSLGLFEILDVHHPTLRRLIESS